MPEPFRQVPIDQLLVDPSQPRKTFSTEEIERLAVSIRARGILVPLRVLWSEERQKFVIICGESRFRAAQLAKIETLPCVVVLDANASEADLLADRIVENEVRNDLSSLDYAHALSKLKRLKGCTSQALASELGLSNAAITRAEALLTLPEPIQALIGKGLSESAAYAISRLDSPEQQFELAEKAVAGSWSRGLVEQAVHAQKPAKKTALAGSKLALKFAGIAVNFKGDKPLKWAELLTALERMQAEAKRLSDGNKSPAEWAKALAG